MAYDSFNYSVRKRLESVRIGSLGTPFASSRPRASDEYGQAPGYNPGYNPGYGAGPGYNPPGQSYGGGYNQGMNQGYNPGYNPPPTYNNAPSSYNSGYNPGYNPGQGYNNTGTFNTGYGTQNYGTQGYGTTDTFGTNGYSYGFSSDEAYAMAPSSRASSVASARRRQLDCVYYSGFTVWADIYQTWARQRSRGFEDGYRYRTFGPAVGFDWTSGPVTLGAAMTYSWGNLKGRDTSHEQKMRTWGMELYGQYNSDNFYVNGTLGYGHNSFRSRRNAGVLGSFGDKYNSNSFNIDGEFGWKLNWSGFQVIPTAGLRWYHDRRGSINEGNANWAVHAGARNYHVLEMPIGVNFLYEINTGGMVFVPRARLAWIPELSRKRGAWDGVYGNGLRASQNGAQRSRHGFQAGLGMEAKITKSLSAHIDYNCNFRSKQYEHHWNLGAGFTF